MAKTRSKRSISVAQMVSFVVLQKLLKEIVEVIDLGDVFEREEDLVTNR